MTLDMCLLRQRQRVMFPSEDIGNSTQRVSQHPLRKNAALWPSTPAFIFRPTIFLWFMMCPCRKQKGQAGWSRRTENLIIRLDTWRQIFLAGYPSSAHFTSDLFQLLSKNCTLSTTQETHWSACGQKSSFANSTADVLLLFNFLWPSQHFFSRLSSDFAVPPTQLPVSSLSVSLSLSFLLFLSLPQCPWVLGSESIFSFTKCEREKQKKEKEKKRGWRRRKEENERWIRWARAGTI